MLTSAARAWADAVAPGAGVLLDSDAGVADAVRAAFERDGGPVLLAAGDAPRLSARHARMALDDLADGADATVGPAMDGGWYLVGLARPHASLLELVEADLAGEEVMTRIFGVATSARLDVGMLRMERLLRTSRDIVATRVDPMTPASLRVPLSLMG